MNNISTDINSIFPIIINIIKNNFVLFKRLEKLISLTPYNDELVVLVRVNIDNLNEFSKFILSRTSTLDKIKIPIKKDINIKKDKLTV